MVNGQFVGICLAGVDDVITLFEPGVIHFVLEPMNLRTLREGKTFRIVLNDTVIMFDYTPDVEWFSQQLDDMSCDADAINAMLLESKKRAPVDRTGKPQHEPIVRGDIVAVPERKQ